MTQGNHNMTHEYRLITNAYGFLPEDIRIKNDGTIWTFSKGKPAIQMAPTFNENGKPMLEFLDQNGKRFLFWLQIEVFKLFGGVIHKGSEVYAIDNNKANLAVSNLAVRDNEKLSGYKMTNPPIDQTAKLAMAVVHLHDTTPPPIL